MEDRPTGTRQSLTVIQKQKILDEYDDRIKRHLPRDQESLALWAKQKFRLLRPPSQPVISRIIREGSGNALFRQPFSRRQRCSAHPEFESALHTWIIAQFSARRAVTGYVITTAGKRLLEDMNKNLPPSSRIELKLSRGWLYKFQQRHNLRSVKSHGESGDANNAAISTSMSHIQNLVRVYKPEDRFNADEFGLFYQLAPDRTVASQPLPGRKKQKARLSYLACANSDGSERLPLMVIGKSKCPRVFKKKFGQELGFDYHSNKKAWMKADLFSDWILRFSSYVSRSGPTRRVLLLIDNASSHGTNETLPNVDNIDIVFLPPNTTSKMQPMDAGIIASLKARYRRMQYEQALDNIDSNVPDIYKIDQLSAMRAVRKIWGEIPNTVFWNCWLYTGTMDGTRMGRSLSHEERELASQLTDLVNNILPTASRASFSLDYILNPVEENDCMAGSMPSVLASVAAQEILEGGTEPELDQEEGFLDSLTIEEKLKCVAVTKRLLDENDCSDSTQVPLRAVQRSLKRQRVQSMSQSAITDFFASK